jgi:putative ABC transport system permease protein
LAALDHPTTGILPAVRPEHRRHGMGVLEALRVAHDGLAANKLRSFLTMLGVIIGVAAVIVMVALGQGAAKATQEAIQKLGTNRLYIRPQELQTRGVSQGLGTGENLRLEDAETIRRNCRLLAAVSPEYRESRIRVKYKNENTLTDVYGTSPEYFAIRSIPVERGRGFTAEEVKRRARVAVIGPEIQRLLFGRDEPLGKYLRIMGQRFLVIAVTRRVGGQPWGNRDEQVTVPVTTAMRRLFGADRIRSLSVTAVSADKMLEAEDEIIRVMRKAHKTKPDEEDPVRIFNQADMMETANEQGAFLTMLLAGIALVSLIVGGIGIMNIMLVSVTERTREIGIRKAIGAKRKDILYQFLIESVALSLAGGLTGIGIGLGVAFWMAAPQSSGGLGFPMLMTLPPIVISFASSAFVGIFFGIYPAVKASGLNPIEALRYE